MATLEEIRLPDIGDFSAIPVIEILVAPGDRIEPEQSLLTLESDKATMEIPSPAGGLVRELMVKIGDEISTGDLLLKLETDGAADRASPAPDSGNATSAPAESGAETSEKAPAKSPAETGDAAPAEATSSKPAPGDKARRPAPVLPRPADMAAIARGRTPHASPTVRRFARELGVDLGQIKGTGAKGRILKEDVQSFVKEALQRGTAGSASGLPFQLPAAPAVDFSRFGPIEEVPLTRIKRISGSHLHRAWLTVPSVTQFDEADITELEAFRRNQAQETAGDRPKLTLLPFLLKAVAAALAAYPPVKASLTADGERLVLKHYTHIGIAVDTAEGLLVPVIRDVDRKGLLDLAGEVADLSSKARAGKLLPGDMQGGCFTISSLGGVGGTAFTPIVNHPEVAILGVSPAATRPVWDGQAFIPRQLLPLALAYDHRVVDGADGARFTRYLAEVLADIRRLLL